MISIRNRISRLKKFCIRNSIWSDRWFEPRTSRIYRARTQTTELKSHTHRRPVAISICLKRFIPESTRNHAGTDETVPLLPATQKWTHTEPHYVKGEEKLPIIYTPAEYRPREPLHANPNLYCAGIKAVQVCYIPYTSTYCGIPPSVAGSFQICKICFFQLGWGRLGMGHLFIVSLLVTWKEDDYVDDLRIRIIIIIIIKKKKKKKKNELQVVFDTDKSQITCTCKLFFASFHCLMFRRRSLSSVFGGLYKW